MNALDNNRFTQDWQQLLAEASQDTPPPKAILYVSAHWCTSGVTALTAHATPETIHDFSGFPPALFNCRYPAPGAPELASELATQLQLSLSEDWGLDHGAWSVLMHLFPKADIPVLQLSLDLSKAASWHWQLGQKIKDLREQGVLLIGSGNIVHNIGKWMADPTGPFDWGKDFDTAVSEAIKKRQWQSLIAYQQLPYAADAVPSAEHYLPLLYVLASAEEQDDILQSNFPAKSLEDCSMRSIALRPARTSQYRSRQ